MHKVDMSHVIIFLILLSYGVESNQDAIAGAAGPVFQLDVPNPTADKPQSKLWYAHGYWWACLPTRDGNQLWKRSSKGWTQAGGVEPPFRGLLGHGDVYAGQDAVHVVLASGRALIIVALRYDSRRCDYVRAAPATTWPFPADESIETATITKDQTGRLWVAYDSKRSIWVRASRDPTGVQWTDPIQLGHAINDDDICAIARLRGGVGVIWSNQNDESISFRFHGDASPPETWNAREVVAQGDETADDHLNCAVADDGTLYVATKTSLDTLNRPLLSLRERRPDGRWQSHAYATLTSNEEPSRPIAIVSRCPKRLVLCHSLYRRRANGAPVTSIIGLICRHPDPVLHRQGTEIIQPVARLNNVTGCKSSLPANVPSVVLASNGDGNVYEGIVNLSH